MPERRHILPRYQCDIVKACRLSNEELAFLYGVTVREIARIKSGNYYVDRTDPLRTKLTAEQREKIRNDPRTCAAIAANYSISRMAVSMIKRGTWGKGANGEPVRIRGRIE